MTCIINIQSPFLDRHLNIARIVVSYNNKLQQTKYLRFLRSYLAQLDIIMTRGLFRRTRWLEVIAVVFHSQRLGRARSQVFSSMAG